MPKKSEQSKSSVAAVEAKPVEQPAVATPAPVAAPVAAAAAPVKAPKKSKVVAEAAAFVAAPAPVVEEPAPVAAAAAASSTSEQAPEEKKSQRHQLSDEDLMRSFDQLLERLDAEIEHQAETKSKGIKLFRSLAKDVRQLRTDTSRLLSKRVSKKQRSTNRNENSGFMKPVKVTPELSKFLGKEGMVSRVDVTKSICSYIKTNNLQSNEDRRQFIPDDKLAKLLGTKQPLTYYKLQEVIQPHFPKAAKASA